VLHYKSKNIPLGLILISQLEPQKDPSDQSIPNSGMLVESLNWND